MKVEAGKSDSLGGTGRNMGPVRCRDAQSELQLLVRQDGQGWLQGDIEVGLG